ncbi:20608_t:CDS:10 [Entrophospora sp. SA101]|nr:20608_t:CDS:10 [Entrophospora sp. SA101]
MGAIHSKNQRRKLRKKKSSQSADSRLSHEGTESDCDNLWQGTFSAPVEDCLLSNSKVLDIGCLSGSWILDMAEKYPHTLFYGLESNTVPPPIIPRNANFFKANILSLPFEDEEFDYARIGDMMSAFSDIEWEQALSEIIRVTKCGGWIEISEWDLSVSKKIAPNYFRIVEALSTLKGRNPNIVAKMEYLMHSTKQLLDINGNYKKLLLGPKAGDVGMLAVGNLVYYCRDCVGELIADHLNLSMKDYNQIWKTIEEELKNNNVFTKYCRFWAQKNNTTSQDDFMFSNSNNSYINSFNRRLYRALLKNSAIMTPTTLNSAHIMLNNAKNTLSQRYCKSKSFITTTSTLTRGTDIDHKKLQIQRSENLKPLIPNKDLVFGKSFSDHMLSIEWNSKDGWSSPIIKPYGKISLEPSAMVFHYSFECFEGLKAYKDKDNRIRMFRPDMNMERFKASAKRLTLPDFNGEELIECLKKLLILENRWISNERGYSLYVRPTLIGTQESLGVGECTRALLFVICSPVGPYYKTGFSAVKLLATTDNVRAWPGGTGDAKIGGNYAPCVKPQVEAARRGYQQNLWLFGDDDEITEVELVTPPLNGTILAGVTRDSIIGLAKSWNEFKVSERKIVMSEVLEALEDGRLYEMFGSGTACIVSPIKGIHYRGKDLVVPLDPKNPNQNAGPITRRFADTLMGIQYGEIPHEWSIVL